MIRTEQIDITSKSQVNEFVMFPFSLYKECPQWVPPFISDIKVMLDPQKHPFYEHSEADFFVAKDNGKIVGRIAALENKPYNKYHDTKQVVFYLLECIDDQDAAKALFERVYDWGKKRGLNALVGQKGFSGFDGYGIQVEGFEHRQMMTMMNYNLPYLPKFLENLGFEKEVDFVSCYMNRNTFKLPEKAKIIAEKVKERGVLKIKSFQTKSELKKWAWKIGQAYNNCFVNNWEYYPLTEREVKFAVDSVITVADQHLIKLITYKDDVIGFIFVFPDISAALQRQRGRLTPWGLADFLLEMRKTKWVAFNGVGVLPEFHGRGGNALLYSEMVDTIQNYRFEHAEQTQMADTAVQVRKDMVTIGAQIYKRHRVYRHAI
jgi:GNAT superfamily N-acetyltransferase